MALAASNPFASFGVNAQTNILDISDVLSEALILDFDFLSQGMNFALDDPVEDTTFYWNTEALNADTVTVSSSATSTATSIVLTTGHGARVHVGDLAYDTAINAAERMQVTLVTTDTLTVTRTYNSTVAASVAASATLAIIPMYQEGTDIGTVDKSVAPTAANNFTQIIFAGDLLIARSQLARRMATIAMDVNRQLANRAIELKRGWTRACLYGEKSASSGSNTVYRSTLGMNGWIRDNSGIVTSTSEAMAWSVLNTQNKLVVDKGRYCDTLLIGTDLVGSIAGIDSTLRRWLESDTHGGYTVNMITLAQGNEIKVIIDGRVKTGDWFLYTKNDVAWHPLAGSGMFVIAATDFVDGIKRRIGSEGGLEFRHPEAAVFGSNRT